MYCWTAYSQWANHTNIQGIKINLAQNNLQCKPTNTKSSIMIIHDNRKKSFFFPMSIEKAKSQELLI